MALTYLDPVALARIGNLSLKARTVVEGALAGLHRSPHHGSSVEFAEHKEYSPGDEIRHIDWKAYGKFDRFYVKRFEEETELSAYLLVDRSGSMAYRGKGIAKLEYAAYLAAALAYLLIRQQDRVGLLAFGGGEPTYVPPRGRTTHLMDLHRVIEELVTEGGRGDTRLEAALDRVAELARRRRSLVVVLSDCFERSPRIGRLLAQLRAQGNDVRVVQLLDRDELELPFDGVTIFESLEDDRRLIADPHAVRRAYLEELGRFLGGLRRACDEAAVAYHLVPTDTPVDRALLGLLSGPAGRDARHADLGPTR